MNGGDSGVDDDEQPGTFDTAKNRSDTRIIDGTCTKRYKSVPADEDTTRTFTRLSVDPSRQTVYYDRIEIGVGGAVTPNDDDFVTALEQKVTDLGLVSGVSMETKQLVQLIRTATNGRYIERDVEKAALFTNLRWFPGDLAYTERTGGLHRLLYAPISQVLRCFDYDGLFCTNTTVPCAHCCAVIGNEQDGTTVRNYASCQPDVALRLTDDFCVIAMMELKAKTEDTTGDMYNCILMTCLSLLAIVEHLENKEMIDELVEGTDKDATKVYYSDIAIPFLLGYQHQTQLYVTRIDGKGKAPTITKVMDLSIATYAAEELAQKAMFVATWAVLVSDIYTIIDRTEFSDIFEGYDQSIFMQLDNAILCHSDDRKFPGHEQSILKIENALGSSSSDSDD
jgi:hypothetical protein